MFFVDTRPVRALLLAADPGEGFENTRWLARWGATTLIEHVVAGTSDWPVDEVVLVLGPEADRIVDECDLGDVTIVINPEWEEGEAGSVRVGVDVLARGEEGPLVVSYGSIPGMGADDVAAVVDGHDGEESLVTVTTYRYVTDAPYVIEPELWPRLLGREGDASLDILWKAHPEWVRDVHVDRLPPRRIDTPMDLEDLAPR